MANWRSIAKCASDLRIGGRTAERHVESILAEMRKCLDALNKVIRNERRNVTDMPTCTIDEFDARVAWWVMNLVDADVSRFLVHSEGDDIPEIAADRFGMVDVNEAKEQINSLDNLMGANEMLQALNTEEACKFIDDVVERLNELAEKSPTYRAMIEDKLDV